MDGREMIAGAARALIAEGADSIPKLVLLRKVLRTPAGDPETIEAHRAALQDQHVLELVAAQRNDGGWGRFHSADSRARCRIPTTEWAVRRALAMGLDAASPVLTAAVAYLSGLVEGRLDLPDPPEKNDRWSTGKELFAAATLALVSPDLPILDRVWAKWVEIGRRTFESGIYDSEAEVRAHRALTGASVRDSYLTMNNHYALALLTSRPDCLPRELECSLLAWLCSGATVIKYVDWRPGNLPDPVVPSQVERWFRAAELLCRFEGWRKRGRGALDWLWLQRREGGLWDFGPQRQQSWALPLSRDWRSRRRRVHDYSTRALVLLGNSYRPCRAGSIPGSVDAR